MLKKWTGKNIKKGKNSFVKNTKIASANH
jgi:hypothetical protein